MELKRVELNGFKSFPEKTTVEFDKGITAIVGPNGSGKSNISDAVRWVLGEQSAKQLRGGKMEDIIFTGTERRKPLNFAQVTLVLDNSDRKMSLAYDEIAISRSVFRSGESEYAINGSRCRLKDVQELLMDTGIGKDGYSIIGQGQIDRLLSNKPADRRAIFEEAAGIVKFKSRKETAEKQLADEEVNMSRVEDILTELNARVEPLTEQAQSAEVYLKLKEELKAYEITSFLGQYKQYNEQFRKVQDNLDDLLVQLHEAKTRKADAEAEAEQYREEAQQAQEAYRSLSESHHQLQLERTNKEGEKAVYLEQKSAAERDIARLNTALDDIKAKLHAQLTTLDKEEALVANKKKELADKEEQHEAAVKALGEAVALQAELKQKSDEAAVRAANAKAETAELKGLSERAATLLEMDESRQSEIGEREQELRSEKEALQAEVEAENRALDEREDALKKEADSINEALASIQELRAEIREKQQKMQELVDAQREIQNRIKWLGELEADYEGFGNSVKSVMQLKKQNPTQYRKVRGTLAELITVPKELAVAVEIALGASLQNIVTEDQATAKSLIEYLRREQKGRATFMPMDRVSARGPVSEKKTVLAMKGVKGFADELIGYAADYSAIVSRQLGNVVITDDFDSAAEVANRYGSSLRVVTLKGDIFNIGGSITGGSAQKAGSILSRKGEADDAKKLLSERSREVEAANKEVTALVEKRQAMNLSVEERSNALTDARTALLADKAETGKKLFRLEQLATELEKLTGSRGDLSEIRREHEDSANEFEQKINAAEEKAKLLEEDAARLLAECEEAAGNAQTERSRELELRIGAAGLQQEIEYMQRAMERENEGIDALNKEAEESLRLITETNAKTAEITAALETLDREEQSLEKKIAAGSADVEKMSELQNEKNELWAAGMQTVNTALEEITRLEKEQMRLDNQKARAERDLTDLQDRIWEDYELTYNAALKLERTDLGSQTAMKRRIGELREEIKGLGNVNVNAITELTALRERLDFLTVQRDDIAKSETELRELIGQLESSMGKQFDKAFERVKELFEETFRKLFGGGHTLLKMTEEEEGKEAGVEIIAQPPGKKLSSMTQLSGGERALTAIALLFAIQQLNPAPFCILDEIDAALDEANVSRYSDYLAELSGKTQFIVITHRKGTMESANTMYGVTMEEKGISKCVSTRME